MSHQNNPPARRSGNNARGRGNGHGRGNNAGRGGFRNNKDQQSQGQKQSQQGQAAREPTLRPPGLSERGVGPAHFPGKQHEQGSSLMGPRGDIIPRSLGMQSRYAPQQPALQHPAVEQPVVQIVNALQVSPPEASVRPQNAPRQAKPAASMTPITISHQSAIDQKLQKEKQHEIKPVQTLPISYEGLQLWVKDRPLPVSDGESGTIYHSRWNPWYRVPTHLWDTVAAMAIIQDLRVEKKT